MRNSSPYIHHELHQSPVLLCLHPRKEILEWISQKGHRARQALSFSEQCLTTRITRALSDNRSSVS